MDTFTGFTIWVCSCLNLRAGIFDLDLVSSEVPRLPPAEVPMEEKR